MKKAANKAALFMLAKISKRPGEEGMHFAIAPDALLLALQFVEPLHVVEKLIRLREERNIQATVRGVRDVLVAGRTPDKITRGHRALLILEAAFEHKGGSTAV